MHRILCFYVVLSLPGLEEWCYFVNFKFEVTVINFILFCLRCSLGGILPCLCPCWQPFKHSVYWGHYSSCCSRMVTISFVGYFISGLIAYNSATFKPEIMRDQSLLIGWQLQPHDCPSCNIHCILHYVRLPVWECRRLLYSVFRKKRDRNVFCNIFYKTWAILMKFVTSFPRNVGNVAKEGVQNMHHCSGAINDATDEWLLQWRRCPSLGRISPVCSHSLF